MKRIKFNTTKNIETVCKEIEEMIPCVLGTKPNKTKQDKSIVYYPARRFMGSDDSMDDVKITVRKVNNSQTNIKLENTQYHENECSTLGLNWRVPNLNKAYEKLENVLKQMYKD